MPTPNWCFYQRSITLLLCTNEAHHLPAAAHPHGFAAQQQNRGLGAGAKWGVCMAATARQVSGVEQERWCLWSFPSARCCCANGEFCSARSHAEFALLPRGVCSAAVGLGTAWWQQTRSSPKSSRGNAGPEAARTFGWWSSSRVHWSSARGAQLNR